MDEKLDNIIRDARNISLTADEKAAGREMLRSYMALTPIRAAAEAPARAARTAFRFPAFGTLAKAVSVFSLVLATMLSAAGVSYAAEGALPGDTLYPVKVSVNEELRAALAPTPEAKAAWEAERAERRLAEAETLAKKGELKAETRTALENDFKRHSEKAQAEIAEFNVASDTDAAANVAAHLEGSLRAHKKIIAALAADADSQDSSEVVQLTASVDAEAAATEQERGKAEAKVAERASVDAEPAAQGRHGAAQDKIAEVRAYLAEKRDTLGAGAVADAEARLTDAQAAVADGDAKAGAGDFGGAFASYGKAQRLAQEAKLLIRARHDLQIRVKLDENDVPAIDAPKPDERGGNDRQRQDAPKPDQGSEDFPHGDVRPGKGDLAPENGAAKDERGVRADGEAKVKLDF